MMEKQEYLNKIYEKYEIEKQKKVKNKFYQVKFYQSKLRYLEMAAMFVLAIGITFGVNYSTNNSPQNYEKVWKEPKEYHSFEEYSQRNSAFYKEKQETLEKNIAMQEDKTIIQDLITKEEAKEKAICFIEKVGYGKQDIKKVNLYKIKENQNVYFVKTRREAEGGLQVEIDANTGNVLSFSDLDLKYQHYIADQLTKEQATEFAKEILEKTGLNLNENYFFKKVEEGAYYFQNRGTNQWQAEFCKMYDGVYHDFEKINIVFLVYQGEIKIDTIKIQELEDFKDNPVKLTKEEASEIAKEKDREFETREIVNVKTELTFAYMNPFVYAQERSQGKDDGIRIEKDKDGTEQIYSAFESERIVRKVWKVMIQYDHTKDNSTDYKQYSDRVYYVDATTSEIIGGNWNINELK